MRDAASEERGSPNWCGRHLRTGALMGLTLGALGQLLVFALARGEFDATLTQRVAAVICSAAFWMCASTLLSLLTLPLLRWRAGRAWALLMSGTLLGGLALLVSAGVALRLMSGSYLTAGAVMFSLNSSEHFVHAALGDYKGFAVAMIALVCGVAYAIARWFRPVARLPARPTPGQLGGLLVVGLVLSLVYLRRGDSRFTRGMFTNSPLLALVSSMDTSIEIGRLSNRPEVLGAPLAPMGPPLATGEAWKAALSKADGPRPNVLLMTLESIAPGHMGVFGYERNTTPTMDRLAAEGLTLSRAWATATHSNYAQMAVLSSLFPRRVHGLDQYTRLDYPRVLLHDAFHLLGYDTGTITSQDENWQGMLRFQTTGTPTYFWYSHDFTGEHMDTGTEKIVPDEATTGVVLDWLKRERDKPWALYVNYQATHFPYLIPPDAERRWQPSEPTSSTFTYLAYPESEKQTVVNRYDNAVRYVDDQIAAIRGYLEESGQLDDTLWIITADHGETFYDRGLVTHGRTLYDIESRVPLIMHWPKGIEPERRDEPVSHIDIMPTVLDHLGLAPHPSWQGRSVRKPAPELVGKAPIYMNIQGLRFADALVCWPYKMLLERTSKTPYLFNLERDPHETDNLVDKEREIAAWLTDSLNKQLLAQLDYHREASKERSERYQPRLRPCPDLSQIATP